MDILRASSDFIGSLTKKRTLETKLSSNGRFFLEQWREGKHIANIPFPNGVTDVGKQYLLGAGFTGVTPITTWYFGLINGTSGTPTLAAADTMGSHTGWTEFTAYDEAVRQTWVKAINTGTNTVNASAPGIITVSTGIPSDSFLAGGFITSNNTKAGTTGTLWAAGLFPAPVAIQVTDEFKLNYTTGL